VSQAVCGEVPADATNEPAASVEATGVYSFRTPSGNIFCDWIGNEDDGGGGVSCGIEQADFTPAPEPDDCGEDFNWDGYGVWIGITAEKGSCSGGVLGNAWYGAQLPVLEYGKAIFNEQWACRSAEDGLTCWNTDTHHGFKLSRSAQLTW
jgi:hypothetical protein